MSKTYVYLIPNSFHLHPANKSLNAMQYHFHINSRELILCNLSQDKFGGDDDDNDSENEEKDENNACVCMFRKIHNIKFALQHY